MLEVHQAESDVTLDLFRSFLPYSPTSIIFFCFRALGVLIYVTPQDEWS